MAEVLTFNWGVFWAFLAVILIRGIFRFVVKEFINYC